MGMREVLCEEMINLMEKDERVVFIDADLASANGTLPIRKRFPERGLDAGISEQNMAGMASGMSAYGLKPYICTFTAFSTRRICDQIAISMAYAKQNVKIIGTDSGITAQLNGGTHMSMEDIGVLRSIPEVMIVEVADEVELRKALPVIDEHYGTVYLRMVRIDSPKVYEDDYEFKLFENHTVREGSDVAIFTNGVMVSEALKAAEELKKEGINAKVVNVHTIKPLNRENVIETLKETGCAVTAENHNVLGGLFSAISEVAASEVQVPVKAVGVMDHFGEVGKLDFLMEKYNMTYKTIVEKAKEAIACKNK